MYNTWCNVDYVLLCFTIASLNVLLVFTICFTCSALCVLSVYASSYIVCPKCVLVLQPPVSPDGVEVDTSCGVHVDETTGQCTPNHSDNPTQEDCVHIQVSLCLPCVHEIVISGDSNITAYQTHSQLLRYMAEHVRNGKKRKTSLINTIHVYVVQWHRKTFCSVGGGGGGGTNLTYGTFPYNMNSNSLVHMHKYRIHMYVYHRLYAHA